MKDVKDEDPSAQVLAGRLVAARQGSLVRRHASDEPLGTVTLSVSYTHLTLPTIYSV